MRLEIKRLLLGLLCFSLVFSLLVYSGANRSEAAASAAESDSQPGVIKLTYADAVLDGYGIEKRGNVFEDQDRLYNGEGYLSFFFAENASSTEQAGSATFTVEVTEAGLYKMSIGYYIPEGYGGKATSIQINGVGTGELTLDAPAAGMVRAEKMVSKVMLNAGKNTIKVNRGWGYYGLEYLKLEAARASQAGGMLEAEEGVMSGGVSIETQGKGYSGQGYAAFQQSGSLSFTYKAPSAGMYNLLIGYSAPNGEKKTSMIVNGQTSEISLPEQTGFSEISAGKALLKEGDNTIEFSANWGWYNIDYVKLTAADKAEGNAVTGKLINPEATSEAKALMNYLASQYSHKIISGQQTLEDAEWIGQQTGRFPAIMSTDLMDYSTSRVDNGATSTEVEKMIDWYKRGGIVALCWHWNAPKGIGGNEPGNEWWRGFYTEHTTFDVEYALDHPDSEDYSLLIRDIDNIALQLKRLQDAGVPVLWRPLHEAEGGWFWWGAKGPEPAKRLWKLMVDRLTHYHHLNNLIWVWNSEKPEWYPGDDVVDIASVDTYNPAGDYNPSIAKYEGLSSLVNNKKLIGLAENGPIPDPDMLQAYGAYWSFFSTWTGDFIKDGTTNAAEHLKKVYQSDYVVTLDELPANLYTFTEFSDLSGHWAKEDIELLADKLLVKGDGGRQFAPGRLTTRAEFTVIITRALGLSASSTPVQFTDVPETKWYAEPIRTAAQAGLITGYSDGTFQPDTQITREQMAVLIVRAAALAGQKPAAVKNVLNQFADASSISTWAMDSVNVAVASGLMKGLTRDHFAAKDSGDRAQAAVMIKRLIAYVN
ncbi:glycosyl hydrolase [Paenibacillus helianthi]|uniref:glycosyl hydrolase n=1 Tax=Paenibacillus helianthi TaxID=1349432 RepID=UPI0009394832|nr:glycosyl hydrolase [Paenibacillus helianthi]